MKSFKALVVGAACGAFAVAVPLWAPQPTGPLTTFVDGTLASAGAVNANFAAVRDRLDQVAGGAPDYDSGWIAAQASTTNQVVLNHGLGTIPRRFQLMLADAATNPTVVRYADANTQGLSGFASPETTAVTANHVMIGFFSGDYFIYCDANNPTINASGTVTSCTTIESGFMRVLLWK